MEANELRIGNYLNGYFNTNEGFEKQSFQISHLVISEIAESTHDYEPIPLTEEWLVKFGFDTKNYHDGYTGKDVGNTDFVISEPNRMGFKHGYAFEFHSWKYTELKYVHQLQNLYFALTGEELQIKEQ